MHRVAVELVQPSQRFYLEIRNRGLRRDSKAPVAGASRTATSHGRIGVKARQTSREMNIQMVNPAGRSPDIGFGHGLMGE